MSSFKYIIVKRKNICNRNTTEHKYNNESNALERSVINYLVCMCVVGRGVGKGA